MLRSHVLFLVCVLLSFSGHAWAGLGNDNAPKGGAYSLNIGGEPTTINPLNSTDLYAQNVQSYILESLATRNDDTYEWEPVLATSWTVSKDGKEFTFKLRQGVTWHDGQPLTAEDVKFSYDVIFDSHYDTAQMRPYYEGIEKVEIIDPQTVKFTTKTKYFANFESAAGMPILPKHIYGDLEKGPKINHELIGTGPYMLDKNEKGKRIVLKRNPKWWGVNVPYFKDQDNVDPLILKFAKEETVSLEMLKKGDLDYNDLTPDTYTEKAVGPEWGKTVMKVKAENLSPKSFGFVGWNLKNPLFSDKNVRFALWELMNRKLMIDKFRHGMSLPATGPWYRQSDYASKKVKEVSYDPKNAHKLLTASGWTDADHTGTLSKMIDGKKVDFKFTVILSNQDSMKYLTLYKEDLKKEGIDMEIKYVEWNSFIKLLDERKFDAVNLAWGGGTVDIDPKQIWGTDSIANAGSNFVSYSNPEVDKLIEQARETMDKKKRIPMLQKVYEMIAADAPYAFMFNDKYVLYGVTARTKRTKDTFKYTVGTNHFWVEK
jgi:microcin C transport system substrate-binding protein